ncbi:MAG: BlaI/MecI/CopY family transcriptional regulator [Actinomycetota bacterium]|jgi:predicted transcriptional regulator|nr:BlaI/MecI/CopY family transcriptional regulator [Actinomycetota bacterium]
MAKLAMGALEAEVMDVLWDAGGPLTPGQVHELMSAERPLAYTTAMTILVRLWRKGRLDRQPAGRAYAYRPPRSREAYAASHMDEVLGATKDRPLAPELFHRRPQAR